MSYDLALLIFTIIGLLRMPSSSALWKTLVKQGVIYFVLNFLANLILLVLNRLNLNRKTVTALSTLTQCISSAIMNVIFGMPAACICTVASNRVVLSLLRPSPNCESGGASSAEVPPLTTDFTVTMLWSPSVAEV
ncbi:uncharacterized protein BJ212DRAFT_1404992 [Suillus subaureus]|uniref:Uncharacterized protein n=1 Tax=Suillus subaureus TaxID=48587 RepID=A0A9P7IYX1_9AGAM|nr:uncharacterized protein BJ212DRAFT_1404992 [Suillus subaureus]KAG1797906.1 hypothetical protein BJ212DRAFT_1404992 [Suillus subaureus]